MSSVAQHRSILIEVMARHGLAANFEKKLEEQDRKYDRMRRKMATANSAAAASSSSCDADKSSTGGADRSLHKTSSQRAKEKDLSVKKEPPLSPAKLQEVYKQQHNHRVVNAKQPLRIAQTVTAECSSLLRSFVSTATQPDSATDACGSPASGGGGGGRKVNTPLRNKKSDHARSSGTKNTLTSSSSSSSYRQLCFSDEPVTRCDISNIPYPVSAEDARNGNEYVQEYDDTTRRHGYDRREDEVEEALVLYRGQLVPRYLKRLHETLASPPKDYALQRRHMYDDYRRNELMSAIRQGDDIMSTLEHLPAAASASAPVSELTSRSGSPDWRGSSFTPGLVKSVLSLSGPLKDANTTGTLPSSNPNAETQSTPQKKHKRMVVGIVVPTRQSKADFSMTPHPRLSNEIIMDTLTPQQTLEHHSRVSRAKTARSGYRQQQRDDTFDSLHAGDIDPLDVLASAVGNHRHTHGRKDGGGGGEAGSQTSSAHHHLEHMFDVSPPHHVPSPRDHQGLLKEKAALRLSKSQSVVISEMLSPRQRMSIGTTAPNRTKPVSRPQRPVVPSHPTPSTTQHKSSTAWEVCETYSVV